MMRTIWRERASYLLIMPIVVLYLVFSIYPIINTFQMSFYDAKIVKLGPFVGFKNYAGIVSDPYFRQAFTNSITFTAGSIIIILVVSTVLSVLLNAPTVRFRTFFKVIYFLPVVTSFVATSYIWKWMYDPVFGVVNTFLGLLGIQGPEWLSDPDIALLSLVLVNAWKWTGYFMVIIMANLQLIEPELYEAAAIDGASSLHQFFRVTLPLLRGTLGLCVLLCIVNFLRTFSLVFVMTRGGPAGATEMITTFVYMQAFGTGRMAFGLSAAASMLLFALIMVFTLISNRLIVRRG